MKTKLILMSLILSVSSVIYAGPGHHEEGEGYKNKEHKGKQMRQKHFSDLNLTESQQVSFDAIMKDQKERMKAAMDVIHTDTHAELSKVLTAEQMQMLEEKRQHRKDNKKMHMKKRIQHHKQKNRQEGMVKHQSESENKE